MRRYSYHRLRSASHLGQQLIGIGEVFIRVQTESRHDERVTRLAQMGVRKRQGSGELQVGLLSLAIVFLGMTELAGEHLVKNDAERIHVIALVWGDAPIVLERLQHGFAHITGRAAGEHSKGGSCNASRRSLALAMPKSRTLSPAAER